MILETLHKNVEHIPTSKTITAGAAGSTVSIVAALSDPSQVEPWLRLATLGVGFLTGLGSLVLVTLKCLDALMPKLSRIWKRIRG